MVYSEKSMWSKRINYLMGYVCKEFDENRNMIFLKKKIMLLYVIIKLK